jgi:hypothetical protein
MTNMEAIMLTIEVKEILHDAVLVTVRKPDFDEPWQVHPDVNTPINDLEAENDR